jgi:hypothetical protein
VPLIRWPLLPVAAQLQFSTEPLLVSMMTQDAECCILGMSLLTECNAGFAKSEAAVACPRLKRRKGTVVPVLPLAFTAFRQQCYTVSEDGALLTATDKPGHRAALCSERVMNSGKSCAEVTVVAVNVEVLIGVARPTVDVNAVGAFLKNDFWGMTGSNGTLPVLTLHHNGNHGHDWQGKQEFTTGDVLRLLLDSDAGTLTVKKNGTLLGVAVTQGLTGDLCWAVTFCGTGDSVRIKAVDPAEF